MTATKYLVQHGITAATCLFTIQTDALVNLSSAA